MSQFEEWKISHFQIFRNESLPALLAQLLQDLLQDLPPKNANPAVWKLIFLEGTRSTKLSTIHLQIKERRYSHNGDDISKKGYGPLIRFRILKVQ